MIDPFFGYPCRWDRHMGTALSGGWRLLKEHRCHRAGAGPGTEVAQSSESVRGRARLVHDAILPPVLSSHHVHRGAA